MAGLVAIVWIPAFAGITGANTNSETYPYKPLSREWRLKARSEKKIRPAESRRGGLAGRGARARIARTLARLVLFDERDDAGVYLGGDVAPSVVQGYG